MLWMLWSLHRGICRNAWRHRWKTTVSLRRSALLCPYKGSVWTSQLQDSKRVLIGPCAVNGHRPSWRQTCSEVWQSELREWKRTTRIMSSMYVYFCFLYLTLTLVWKWMYDVLCISSIYCCHIGAVLQLSRPFSFLWGRLITFKVFI